MTAKMDQKRSIPPITDLTSIGGAGERVIALDCDFLAGPAGQFALEGLTHLRLDALSLDLLASLEPSLIILPLFAATYDAAKGIEVLEGLGYKGKLVVLAPALPKPRLVEAELRGLGPSARLTLVSPQNLPDPA